MEQNKEISACVQVEVLHKNVPLEFGVELSLPDYRSEISRLLWVRPTVLPPVHFVGGGNVDFSGRVCYNVLYAGPDGGLHVAQAEGTYGFSLPIENGSAPVFSVCVTPDAVIGRVVAPRKLTVRCRAGAQVMGYADAPLAKGLHEPMLARACTLMSSEMSGRFVTATSDAIEVGEDFAAADVAEVLHAHAEVFLPDVSVGEGVVRCRGDVIVTLLCRSGEATMPITLTRRLPAVIEVESAQITPDFRASVSAVVSEIVAVAQEGRISLSLSLLPSVEAMKNESVRYVHDLYLQGKSTVCQRGVKRLWKSEFCGNRNFSITEAIPLSDLRLNADDTIIDAYAEAELAASGNGEITCHVLYCRGSEFGVSEASFPFRVTLEGEGSVASLTSHVPILRVHAEGDRLRVDAELGVCMRTVSDTEIDFVQSAEEGKSEARGYLDMELCYPTPTDTLWEIGKRYAVPPEQIAAHNGMSGEDPSATVGISCLQIPVSSDFL